MRRHHAKSGTAPASSETDAATTGLGWEAGWRVEGQDTKSENEARGGRGRELAKKVRGGDTPVGMCVIDKPWQREERLPEHARELLVLQGERESVISGESG